MLENYFYNSSWNNNQHLIVSRYFPQGFIPVMIALILEEETKHGERQTKEDSSHRSKIDIKRVFLSDLMLLLNHNHNNCRYIICTAYTIRQPLDFSNKTTFRVNLTLPFSCWDMLIFSTVCIFTQCMHDGH